MKIAKTVKSTKIKNTTFHRASRVSPRVGRTSLPSHWAPVLKGQNRTAAALLDPSAKASSIQSDLGKFSHFFPLRRVSLHKGSQAQGVGPCRLGPSFEHGGFHLGLVGHAFKRLL